MLIMYRETIHFHQPLLQLSEIMICCSRIIFYYYGNHDTSF